MERKYFDTLMESLEDAVAYSKGEKHRCRTVVHENPIPPYKARDVARTRRELNLSQRGLAAVIGVSTRTVEAWESGVNIPSGPSRHLLYLLDQDHSLVDRLVTR